MALTGHSDEQVLGLLSGLEERRRRLATVDHAIISEVEERGLGRERGCKRTSGLLAQLLRVSAGEANARVRAAKELAPRRGLTGQPMPAVYPQLAAAQAAGVVSEAQARIITRTIAELPPEVRDEHFDQVEGFLVGQAEVFGPDCLAKIARRLLDTIDPDGKLQDAKYRERRRHLTVHQRADGSAWGSFELTALCAIVGEQRFHEGPDPARCAVPPRVPRAATGRHRVQRRVGSTPSARSSRVVVRRSPDVREVAASIETGGADRHRLGAAVDDDRHCGRRRGQEGPVSPRVPAG